MSRNNSYFDFPENATSALSKFLATKSPMPFVEYMSHALYHPDYGYYAKAPQQIGKHGDFFTSVSCGPLFGRIIARYIASWWTDSQITGPWRIIEPGPNNAALACDILQSLAADFPEAYATLEYLTIDPMPRPLAFQQEVLAAFGKTARCVSHVIGLDPQPTFVIANEIIDALPCRLIEYAETGWHEIYVQSDALDGKLIEIKKPLPCCTLPNNYPIGYRTEIRDNVKDFLASFTAVMSTGRLLFFDYGFAAPEYYHRDRTTGTLRCYRNHRALENPLENPGEMDITAHVDFTQLAQAAESLPCAILRFEPQEFFLTRHAAPILAELTTNTALIRNFQTLTHPAHLGGKFHVIELSLGENLTTSEICKQRLAIEIP